MSITSVVLLIAFLVHFIAAQPTTQQPYVVPEGSPAYWYDLAKARFSKDCETFPSLKNGKRAKNVIFILGDGMGMPTVAAGRFYAAQMFGRFGSIQKHPYEDWPFNTMARTYDVETSVTDSAGSATAYLGGCKTRTGMIGLTADIGYKQCGAWGTQHSTQSVLEAAHTIGKATGVVTSTRITHASPAGNYGHVSSRYMESDVNITQVCPTEAPTMPCQDLACQLIADHPYINVLMGGGQMYFYPEDVDLPATNFTTKGIRKDGRNLVDMWLKEKSDNQKTNYFVGNPDDLSKLDASAVDYVLALPYTDDMPYNHELDWGEPNLLSYVKKALAVLERQPNGYYLFIESGRIDHAHHKNTGRKALDETYHLDSIVTYIENNVNLKETLVIVTADHSHSFELVGQPGRFQDVLGLDQYYSNNTNDKLQMQGLNYMNGPNGLNDTARPNPALAQFDSWVYQQQTLVPLPSATHGGDDVGVYATGPMSPIFHVTVDNTMIANAMKFALGAPPFNNAEQPCGLPP